MRWHVLIANEMLKASRRRAVWVAFGAFAGLIALFHGRLYLDGAARMSAAFALPRAWGNVLAGPGSLTALFTAFVVIQLVGSEFGWSTARQNVIDGVSRTEFFLSKLALVAILGAGFFSVLLLVGGGFALAGTRDAGIVAPAVRPSDLAMLGAAFVGLLGWGCLALLVAVLTRRSGAAIAAFLLYVLVEQVVREVLRWQGAPPLAARLLPATVYRSLWSAQPLTPGRAGLASLDTSTLLASCAVYMIVCAGAAYLVFRRRDL
jgi:ABC-type transport system involved in multi-copper enzyme maturation permease subunit